MTGTAALFPAHQLRSGIKAAVTHHRKTLTLSLDGTHNWFRDRANTGQNTATTGFSVNSQWQPRTNFQLVASYGINGVNGDPMLAGSNRAMSVFVQPVIVWRHPGFTFIPLLSHNRMSYTLGGAKTEEMRMTQYGGRVMWQLPRRLRFSTFSLEASMNRVNPSLQAPLQTTPRVLFQWTVIWPPPTQGQ